MLAARTFQGLMALAVVMAVAMLGLVSKLSRRNTIVLSQQKLWAWNMGYEHHEQPPFQTFPVRATAANTQAKIQQLWGFNLGYEHHEQKPIAFGAVAPAAAKQMQLWGWDMGSQMDGKVPLPMGAMPAAKQAKKQQLVGFNLGYEHHEQMPIPFGIKKNGRKTQLVKVDSYDSEAEENMDPALGRGSDQHVLKDGLWIKPEFKNTDDNYALRTLQGKGEAR